MVNEALSILVGRPLLVPITHFLVDEGGIQLDQIGYRGGEDNEACVVGRMYRSLHYTNYDQTEGSIGT